MAKGRTKGRARAVGKERRKGKMVMQLKRRWMMTFRDEEGSSGGRATGGAGKPVLRFALPQIRMVGVRVPVWVGGG